MNYDEQYANAEALFGTEVESTLQQFSDRLKPGSVVLDIGAGQGRNGVFLAERGFTTQDPAFDRHRTRWEVKGENSFCSPEGQVRTYLEPGQIVSLFEVVLSREAD